MPLAWLMCAAPPRRFAPHRRRRGSCAPLLLVASLRIVAVAAHVRRSSSSLRSASSPSRLMCAAPPRRFAPHRRRRGSRHLLEARNHRLRARADVLRELRHALGQEQRLRHRLPYPNGIPMSDAGCLVPVHLDDHVGVGLFDALGEAVIGDTWLVLERHRGDMGHQIFERLRVLWTHPQVSDEGDHRPAWTFAGSPMTWWEVCSLSFAASIVRRTPSRTDTLFGPSNSTIL